MARYALIDIDPLTMSGTELADYLNDGFDAIETNHLDSGDPAYVVAGMTWADNATATLWDFNIYDGADTITLFQVDTTNNVPVFDPANLDGTGATEGQVLGFDGDEWVASSILGISGADGSAASPTYDSASWPGNGMYFPAADTVAIAADEVGRLFITAAGIGNVVAPASMFDFYSDGPTIVSFSRASTNAGEVDIFGRKSRGTTASRTAVVDNDGMLALIGQGYHSTGTPGFSNAAYIILRVDGTPSGNFVPGDIGFFTGTDAATPAERMTLRSTGELQVISGAMSIGVADTTAALLNLYGDNGTQGARQRFYASASEDGTEDYWQIEVHDQAITIGPASNTMMFTFSSLFGSLQTRSGYIAGIDGTAAGAIVMYQGGGGNTPPYIAMDSPNGTQWFLFFEDDGTLKRHSAIPTANTDGTVVGSQT